MTFSYLLELFFGNSNKPEKSVLENKTLAAFKKFRDSQQAKLGDIHILRQNGREYTLVGICL